MSTVTIYGASDDLIEVEGDLVEEFNPSGDEPNYLAFGDGTVLSIEYGKDGMWRVNRVAAGLATYEKTDGKDPDDDYSDRVTLTGDLNCVVFGNRHEKIRKKAPKP